MRASAQLTSEQLKEIIKDEKKTNNVSREAEEEMDGEEIFNPDNSGSVLSTVLNPINNAFEHECHNEAVRMLNAHPRHKSSDDCVLVYKHSISGMPGTQFQPHQV